MADLDRFRFVDLAAGLRDEEVVRAVVGVEGAKQPLLGDRLKEPKKARHRAFLRHQDGRVDGARRVV